MAKNSDNFHINIYKFETILFVFQILAHIWHKKKVIIYKGNKIKALDLENLKL